MSIFGPSISWDPREPLPPELQPHHPYNPPFIHFHAAKPHHDAKVYKVYGKQEIKLESERNGPPNRDADCTASLVEGWVGSLQPKNPTFTTQEAMGNVLAPWSIDINASIIQNTAIIKTNQVFWNNSTTVIPHGAYTFSLPTGCTVTAFDCQIGSKRLHGVVKPKKTAKNEFVKHVAAGRMAGLLEHDTTEVFTTALGNIPPDTRVRIEISYISLLKHEYRPGSTVETTSLTIPTCIASRYGPPPRCTTTTTSDVKQGLSLNIEVVEPQQATLSLNSSTHETEVSEKGIHVANSWGDLREESGNHDNSQGRTLLVRLKDGSMFLDKDFVLEIKMDHAGVEINPQAWIEIHPTKLNHKALMITLPAKCLLQAAGKSPAREREILFLADQSGSMSDKLASLRSAMEFFLKGIPVGTFFNIGCFGTIFTTWSHESVPYSQESLDSASSYVSRSFKANMGGTEILPAVQSLLMSRNNQMWTDIIILTDGQVWRPGRLLATIRNAREATKGQVRFFCLGIGNSVSHALVEGIAEAGGGYAEVVPAWKQDGWEDKLVSIQAAALTDDHVFQTDIKLESAQGECLSSNLGIKSPADLQKLRLFVENRIYILLDQSTQQKDTKNVILTTISPDGEEMKRIVPLQNIENHSTMIHKLAARSVLEDYERGRANVQLIADENLFDDSSAENFACEWGLASRWTSFFLPDEQEVVVSNKAEDHLTQQGFDFISQGAVLVSDNETTGARVTSSRPRHFSSGSFARGGRNSRGDWKPNWKGENDDRTWSQSSLTHRHYRSHPDQWSQFEDDAKLFIKTLAKIQSFDGSFNFTAADEATRLLGQQIQSLVQHLATETITESLLYTSVIFILLERDFDEHKDLWQMIHLKARTYVTNTSEHLSDFRLSRIRRYLGSLKVPMRGSSKQFGTAVEVETEAVPRLTEGSSRDEEGREDASNLHSKEEHRVVVMRAPTGNDPEFEAP